MADYKQSRNAKKYGSNCRWLGIGHLSGFLIKILQIGSGFVSVIQLIWILHVLKSMLLSG